MSDYSIWALEYTAIRGYPDSALLYGTTTGERVLPFYFFVLKRGDHVALVDCGFPPNEYGRSMIGLWDMQSFTPPAEVLSRIGIDPAEVRDVILTHHHFDHAGGLDYFPHARVWIQRREVDNWMAKWTAPPRMRWLAGGLDPETGATLARIGGEGRLRQVEGVAAVLPGVEVRPAFDTHTAGSQYVVIDDPGGPPWVLPGDVACVFENIGGPEGKDPLVPVGVAQGSQECCIRSTDEMLTVAGDDISRILPMHESRLWDLYPTHRSDDGLHVCEIALAAGEPSRVRGTVRV